LLIFFVSLVRASLFSTLLLVVRFHFPQRTIIALRAIQNSKFKIHKDGYD